MYTNERLICHKYNVDVVGAFNHFVSPASESPSRQLGINGIYYMDFSGLNTSITPYILRDV